MKKMYAVVVVLITVGLVVSIISILSIFSSPQTISEGFENGLEEWVADADVPQDPNNPGQPVEWHINRTAKVSRSGQYSLELSIDGRQDDGTIWIERKIETQKNAKKQITVSFYFYSEKESFNTIASICAYVGVRNPEVEENFSIIGSANEVVGWKRYSLVSDIDTGSSEEIWVALGISVRWETHMTYCIDDVKIEIR